MDNDKEVDIVAQLHDISQADASLDNLNKQGGLENVVSAVTDTKPPSTTSEFDDGTTDGEKNDEKKDEKKDDKKDDENISESNDVSNTSFHISIPLASGTNEDLPIDCGLIKNTTETLENPTEKTVEEGVAEGQGIKETVTTEGATNDVSTEGAPNGVSTDVATNDVLSEVLEVPTKTPKVSSKEVEVPSEQVEVPSKSSEKSNKPEIQVASQVSGEKQSNFKEIDTRDVSDVSAKKGDSAQHDNTSDAAHSSSSQLTKSDSLSSISSSESNNSTENLIHSLSSVNLLANNKSDAHNSVSDDYDVLEDTSQLLLRSKTREIVDHLEELEILSKKSSILKSTRAGTSQAEGTELNKKEAIIKSSPAFEPLEVPKVSRTAGSSEKGLDKGIPKAIKPIRFTVRKVSHEPIKSPDGLFSKSAKSTPVLGNSTSSESDQNKLKQLRKAQSKHDYYSSKIKKIDKEIDFLNNLLVPPQNYDVDFPTRIKIGSAVEKLLLKKDELEKKKYTVGVTISRLWRFQEESDIWIKGFNKG